MQEFVHTVGASTLAEPFPNGDTATTLSETVTQVRTAINSPGDYEAHTVAAVLLRHRKPSRGGCDSPDCPHCREVLVRRLLPVLERREKLEMVISAFPYKIPNPRKTVSDLPDMAERRAILALDRLCSDIGELYLPGACVVIGSDGLPFAHVDAEWSDLTEAQIGKYVAELRVVITEVGASDTIRVVSLDEFYFDFGDAAAMRRDLEAGYSTTSREQVYERFKDTDMYRGIKKAFCEDLADSPRMAAGSPLTGKAIKRKASELAVETVYFSMAWRQFLSARFPDALRLSIHPECLHATPAGQEKLGVRFGENPSVWFADKVFDLDETIDISPWQSVWVEDVQTGDGCRMKRWVAEKIGARLVSVGGRPSHFVMARE